MTHPLKRQYISFYVDGRSGPLLKSEDIEYEPLVELVLEGKGSPYEVTREAASKCEAATSIAAKARWLKKNAEEISEAKLDSEEAYRHYMAGRIDELAVRLEPDVADCLMEDEDDEDEDDDDDEEGDKDDEEE